MLRINTMMEPNVCLLLFAAAVTLFLLSGALMDRTRGRAFMKCFIALLIAAILMLLGEAGLWFFNGEPQHVPILKLCAFLSFGCGVAVNALFGYCLAGYVRERERVSWKYAHIIAGICGAFVLLVVISLSNGMLFSFDANGMYTDGPWYIIVEAVDFGTLILELLMVASYRKILSWKGMLSLLSFGILPLLSMLVLPYWNPTPMYMATTLSLILIHNLFHGELTRQLAEKEIQLADSRIAITLSQLQPHFIYNVLNSIYHLCARDPKLAQEAVEKFSDYLRNNMKSIEQKELIPFEEEYQHIQTYLSLEKIRFRTLEIIYDIDIVNFMLPPLTVQPLVENAVKHGVTKKRGGGSVTISTRETENAYLVMVIDTGIGFDPERYSEDGKVHIGIKNVRERLQNMVSGILSITSSPGNGTTAVITIPKKEADGNENHRVG